MSSSSEKKEWIAPKLAFIKINDTEGKILINFLKEITLPKWRSTPGVLNLLALDNSW